MNWFKKYKINKINDTCYTIVKRKGLWKWLVKETYDNKYQAECALHRLEKKFSNVFTYYCSVKPTNKEYVIDSLKKIGYIPSCTFDSKEKYIYTDRNGYIYSTNHKTTCDVLHVPYCLDNDNLFLAIAAINDRNDYMQWFENKVFDFNMCPLPNHRFLCDQNTLAHFGWVNNSPYTYTNGIHNKMTVESIVEMFCD